MAYPETFLRVSYSYDPIGRWAEFFPAGISTKGKIYVAILDSRGVFSGKSGSTLLRAFELQLLSACYYLELLVTDLDNDIVVRFMDDFGKPLGYFYQGEYHLWEE